MTESNIITEKIKDQQGNEVTFRMIKVEGGIFKMGSNEYTYEKPIHQIELNTFYLAEFSMTQELYQCIMGDNPSYFRGKDRPVEVVSWDDAQECIRQLNTLSEVEELEYRLPTEAEWEYAAKGGNKSKENKYSGSDDITKVAWYNENSYEETRPIGLLKKNELGIYDMSGNVWEWCGDWYNRRYYQKSEKKNPKGPIKGSFRVLRGGGWNNNPNNCCSSYRLNNAPMLSFSDVGFRLALSLPQFQ